MPAKIIDGRALAAQIEKDVKDKIMKEGLKPKIIFLVVGSDESTKIYVENKIKACVRVGVRSEIRQFDDNISESMLIKEIEKANTSDATGVLVQLPLPSHITEERIVSSISPEKDVDCCHPENIGKLFYSNDFAPCTAAGVLRLIEETRTKIKGSKVAVINRGHVGKPLAMMLAGMKATVSMCGRNSDIAKYTRDADIVVSATGTPRLINKEMVKHGAVVVDVGISRQNGKVVGDVDASVMDTASFVTPVPGGVGPMTVAMLMKNAAELAGRS